VPPTSRAISYVHVNPGARKALIIGASETPEETMKLVTRFELAARSVEELYSLHREIFNMLVQTKLNTPERRNALASLTNIQIEISSRVHCP